MRLKIFGTQIEITFLFVVIISFMIISDTTHTALFVLVSAFIHELGHLIAMKRLGYKVKSIILSPIGASIVKSDSSGSYKSDIIISLCGPLANLILSLVLLMGFLILKHQILLLYSLINLFLGIFNLLPIASFDGSTILLSILCERMEENRAVKIKRVISITLLTVLSVAGIIFFCFCNKNPTLMITALYMLILEFFELNILKNN